jgi:hypothetical protein
MDRGLFFHETIIELIHEQSDPLFIPALIRYQAGTTVFRLYGLTKGD